MATVTVPGGGGTGGPAITYTYSTGAGQTVAQQIQQALGMASIGGTLTQTSTAGSGQVTTPGSTGNGTSDLVLTSTGATTVVAGTSGSGGTFATYNGPGGNTITASAGVQLIAGTAGGTFFATGTGAAVGALGGNNTITASGASETIAGGAGSNLLIATGTGDIVQSGGTDTVQISGSNDQVQAVGNATVYASGSGAQIYGSATSTGGPATSSVLTVVDSGRNDIINLNLAASEVVTTSGSGAFVQGGPSGTTMTVDDTGTGTVINGLSSNEFVTLSGSGAYVQGGTTGTTMNVTDDGTNDTINALGSAATVTAGGASDPFINAGPGGLQFVGGGTGTATIVGLTGSSVTVTGAQNLIYSAATGNATLNAGGSTGNVRAWLPGSGTGADSIVSGSGNDTLTLGSGADTLNSGSGTDVFYILKAQTAGAQDFITNASITNDTFNFIGYGSSSSAAQLIASATTGSSGVTLTLSDNTKVTFTNLTSASSLTGHVNYS